MTNRGVQFQTKRSTVLPGCSFGLGNGSDTRDDTRTVQTVWLITSLTLAIFLLGVASWFARRALLAAVARLFDYRQARDVRRFCKQFSGCVFAEAALADVAPPELQRLVAQVSDCLKRPHPPIIWYVARVEPGGKRPKALTTFFSLRGTPLIVCASDPAGYSDYQRFQLFHELGHAAGFQTSHSLGRIIAATDAVILTLWLCIFGQDHWFGWPSLIIYLALRAYETMVPPSSPSAEAHADLWGLWGIEVATSPEVVEEVLRVHRHYLGRTFPDAASARLGYIADYMAKARADAHEMHASIEAATASGKPYIVEQDGSATFADGMNKLDRMQLAGPGGLSKARYCSMLFSGIVPPIALGLALATVRFQDHSFRLALLCLLLIGIFSRVAARWPQGCPQWDEPDDQVSPHRGPTSSGKA